MEEITVRVEADVSPTESEEKVKSAVVNIFGNVSMETKGGVLRAEAKGQQTLVKLRDLLRAERIRGAARKAFFRGIRGNTIGFCLNKQVAFAGHVSFSEEAGESPLGPLRVTVECENPKELVDWLAPRTA